MIRSWTAIAVAFAAIFAATGCNDYGNTFQGNTGAFISFISPASATACVATPTVPCQDLTITLTGSNFVAQTYITWDQAKLKTTPVTDSSGNLNTTTITAVVPAADMAKPGKHFVQTQSPFSGTGNNGLSNPVAFFVNPPPNPVPTISSISPNTAVAGGSADLALTITGINFLLTSDSSGGSQVNWNTASQSSLMVTSITSTQIQATISHTLLAAAGTATVTVYNPPAPPISGCQGTCGGAGGGTSNSETFAITSGAAAAKANSALIEEETPAVSLDGRYVAYTASQDSHAQIFTRDTCQGADTSCQPRTMLISSALDGTAGNDESHSPSMSSDGRYVSFSSAATNLVSETSTGRQVYLRDTCLGAGSSCAPSTQLISTDPNGTLVGMESILPSVSASGRFVAFLAVTPSQAAHTTAAAVSKSGTGVTNSGYRQVFVRDNCLGTPNCSPKTTRISLQPGDGSGATTKPAGAAISGDANHVALAGGNTATLFTHSVAVDDGVFLALTKNQQ